MQRKISYWLFCALAGVFLIMLAVFPAEAAQSAKGALYLCARTIVPSLFPFMAVSGMIVRLNIFSKLGRTCGRFSEKLFGVSGAGFSVFLLSLIGGYPLGAMTVSELYTEKSLGRAEAHRLLFFCDNCGPAFAVSVAGAAVFGSVAVGFFLLGMHILCAFLMGILFRQKGTAGKVSPAVKPCSLTKAFTQSISSAAGTCLSVCGFVVFFAVVIGLLDAKGILPFLCGQLSLKTGAELRLVRSLLCGIFEIGSGIGTMAGLSLSRINLAACSFILGWGGLSVQAQAACKISESGLNPASHLKGKLLHGVLSALVSFFFYPLVFH